MPVSASRPTATITFTGRVAGALARVLGASVRGAVRAASVAALALVGLLVVGASPATAAAAADEAAAAADEDVTWTVRTADNAHGKGRTSFTYAINPGAESKDALVVANRGDEPLRLGIYAANGFTTESGQFDLVTRNAEAPMGVGAWVRADRQVVSLDPSESVEVPFTVSIPQNATPGDYAGGIVTSLTQSDDAAGVNVDRRLGIRITLHVGGELRPALAVEDLHVDYSGSFNPFSNGEATLIYTIHNRGNAILGARQAAEVSGPFGWQRTNAGAVDAPPQLLPGESWTVTVPVEGVPPLIRLAGTVTLTPLITEVSGSTTPLDPIEATAQGWAIPWATVILIVVVVGAVVGLRWLSRRRKAQQRQREEARVEAAVAQALRERNGSGSADAISEDVSRRARRR